MLEEAAFIASAIREGSLTGRELIGLALDRVCGLCGSVRQQETIDAARRQADALDIEPGLQGPPLAGVPVIFGDDDLWGAALIRAGAVLVSKSGLGFLGPDETAQAVAAGAAALAIVAGVDAPYARGRIHRFKDGGSILLSRSSRDSALALDTRDAVSGGLRRPIASKLAGSVGKGLKGLKVAFELGAAAVATAFASYAGPSVSIRLLASEQGRLVRDDRAFDEIDVLLSTDPMAADFSKNLAVPLGLDREVFVCSKGSDTAVRVGAVIDALILAGHIATS